MHKKCALFTIRFLSVSTRGFKSSFAQDLRPQPVHRLSRCLRKSERDEPKPGYYLNATALTTNYRKIERSNKYGASHDNTTNDVLSFISTVRFNPPKGQLPHGGGEVHRTYFIQ